MMEKRIAYILYKMIGLIGLIAIVSVWQWEFISEGVMAHAWTTGSILSAFGFSIIMAFVFVSKLRNEVIAFNALKEMWDDIRMGPVEQASDPLWRHYRCSRPGRVFKPPRLLGHAYDLVTDELARTKKIRLSVETMNTLVHKIGQTIDDEKSLLGYIAGLLVFMGLIGTFIGLLHMVGSMGGIIGSLASSSGGAGPEAFQQWLGALQEPLKGMASGFAASLFGLFSSLVVGLLARMAGQAAGVLKHEFESWLAGVVHMGDEASRDKDSNQASGSGGVAFDGSLIQTVGSILSDYARVAGSFDSAVRLLNDIQTGQQQQAQLMDSIAQSLSRFGGGLESLADGVSRTVTTELEATRAMVQEMERAHSTNVRLLAHNHAQTAVQIAAAIEQNAAIVERMPRPDTAPFDARLDNAVREAVRPMGLTVSQQMQRLEDAMAQDRAGQPMAGGPRAQQRLETTISEGFDRLHENIGTAFSAYSGVLKLAVAALDKSEQGYGTAAAEEYPAESMMEQVAG